jgi:HEAT repeat protein
MSPDQPPENSDPGAPVPPPNAAGLNTTNPPLHAAVTENSEDSPQAKHQAYVEERANQLMDLASEDDQESLNTILSELTNRDPEIRKAALEAAVQFGSRDAIPSLTEAALQSENPEEKAAINKAVEFLKLPSLSEVLAQGGGQAAAPQQKPAPTGSPK